MNWYICQYTHLKHNWLKDGYSILQRIRILLSWGESAKDSNQRAHEIYYSLPADREQYTRKEKTPEIPIETTTEDVAKREMEEVLKIIRKSDFDVVEQFLFLQQYPLPADRG